MPDARVATSLVMRPVATRERVQAQSVFAFRLSQVQPLFLWPEGPAHMQLVQGRLSQSPGLVWHQQ